MTTYGAGLDTIGARIRAWRKHLALTGAQLATITGTHVGMIRKYEANQAVPGGKTLIAFSKTGVKIEWLLLGTGSMCDSPETNTRESAILRMLSEIDKVKREALLNEFFARVQDAKQIDDLGGRIDSLIKALAAA